MSASAASTPIPADLTADALRDLLAQHGSFRATAISQGWALSSLHRRCAKLGIASPSPRVPSRTAAEPVEEEGRAVDFAELMGGLGGVVVAEPPVPKAAEDDGQDGGLEGGRPMTLEEMEAADEVMIDDVAPKAERYKIDGSPASRRIVGLEDEVSRLKAELRRAHRSEASDERILDIIGAAACRRLPPADWMTQRDGKATPGAPGIPIGLWSDWHWGEVVDLRQMDGYNEYNPGIACKRLKTLVESTIDYCYRHITNPTYPGIVICLGGDMVSGDIHEELAKSNAQTLMESILDLSANISTALKEIHRAFGRVHVVCVTGNHGRTTHKPVAKGRNATNADWLSYGFASRETAHIPGITWQIADSNDSVFDVYGKRYLLTHGDSLGVKGGDGIIGAAGPIIRGTKKLKAAYAASGCHIDTVLMGHFHNYMTLPGITVNDCLKGYDEWARSMRFEPHPPSQSLHFDHPIRGTTTQVSIFVDDAPQGIAHAGRRGPKWLSQGGE